MVRVLGGRLADGVESVEWRSENCCLWDRGRADILHTLAGYVVYVRHDGILLYKGKFPRYCEAERKFVWALANLETLMMEQIL